MHYGTAQHDTARYRRLVRLKLDEKVCAFGIRSCTSKSCCTRGVAVAVSAMMGTPTDTCHVTPGHQCCSA